MGNQIYPLAVAAVTIGFVHTVFGPDHYLPFIVMSRARGWSGGKTALITFLCGLGHVLSSVLLGTVGVALGIAIFRLERIEAVRGELATWALTAFGLTYLVWGIHRALKQKTHTHGHVHMGGVVHAHPHSHADQHAHPHGAEKTSITPWVLFTIFVLGPCEPLIPILMYPAARHSVHGLVLVSLLFAGATIATMMGLVASGCAGFSLLPLKKIERYTHALAGGALCLCGLAMLFGL